MSRISKQIYTAPKDLKLLWVAAFSLYVGFGIYSACAPNFATEILHIKPMQIGFLEAVRELPGFLCVGIAALTMSIAEPIVGAVAVLLTAGGIGAYAIINGVPSLLVYSFIWSTGLHTWMPLSSSLTLNLAKDDDKGARLGQTAGVGSLGSLLGMAIVMNWAHALSYQVWFVMAACLIVMAVFILFTLRRDIGHGNKPRMVWKPKYRRYYILSLLEGGRKQVFFTFAPYTLTKIYHEPLKTMAMLMVINGIVNMIGAPYIGRLIDRIREKKILMVSYTSLIGVFLCYGLIHHASILCVLYCLDNLIYLSTNCLTTYVQRIASSEDLMPTLSMGVTMNHVAAVSVPLIGGFLWSRFSYPIMFYAGGIVVVISLIFVTTMNVGKPVRAEA